MNHLKETYQPFLRQTEDKDKSEIMKIAEIEILQLSINELNSEIKNNLNAEKAPGKRAKNLLPNEKNYICPFQSYQ